MSKKPEVFFNNDEDRVSAMYYTLKGSVELQFRRHVGDDSFLSASITTRNILGKVQNSYMVNGMIESKQHRDMFDVMEDKNIKFDYDRWDIKDKKVRQLVEHAREDIREKVHVEREKQKAEKSKMDARDNSDNKLISYVLKRFRGGKE